MNERLCIQWVCLNCTFNYAKSLFCTYSNYCITEV